MSHPPLRYNPSSPPSDPSPLRVRHPRSGLASLYPHCALWRNVVRPALAPSVAGGPRGRGVLRPGRAPSLIKASEAPSASFGKLGKQIHLRDRRQMLELLAVLIASGRLAHGAFGR